METTQDYKTFSTCRKCGSAFGPDEVAFGSETTGWQHPFSCPTARYTPPLTTPDQCDHVGEGWACSRCCSCQECGEIRTDDLETDR